MDRILLVTGGASGIGAAVVDLAAAAGYAVAINYRSRADEAEAKAKAISAAGGRAIAVKADVGNPAEIEPMFAAVDARLGRLTALVNCAGIDGGVFRVEAMKAEALNRLMAVNVVGPMLCCGAAIKRMARRYGGNGGAIVNVSSIATRGVHRVPYSAAKGGINALTASIAMEHTGNGIRINATAPGGTEAPPRRIPRNAVPPTEQEQAWYQGVIDQTLDSSLMHRYGTIDEQVAPILFFASDESSYITGSVLPVGGGDLG